ncbi:hypothetical protein BGX21_003481 [Mortierella sp. AD011]|nr:hypothetical protein BGX20_008992 [Mortierella sp. AD010]KAF9400793.1 hypothetical protein BGX21_003481 [Mortierella sp. AD011]
MEISAQSLPPQRSPLPPLPRRKYFHQLTPAPLDLPEIICRIRSHLSIKDIKKCMLVSMIWAKHFEPFLWELAYFNRFNDPMLQKKGHHIRKLVTYSLCDNDLRIVTRDYPNLIELELEIQRLDDEALLSDLFSRVNRIQKLKFQAFRNELGNIQRAFLKPIAKGVLSQLTEIKLTGFGGSLTAPTYQTRMILRGLEGCPLLQTLEFSNIWIVDTPEQWNGPAKNSFSSSNNNGVIPESSPSTTTSSSSSWLPWRRKPSKPQSYPSIATISYVAPHAPGASDPGLASSSLEQQESDENDPHREISAPREDYKSKHLVTLKLGNIYGANDIRIDFVTHLFERSPNLEYLSLRATPSDIENLAKICPKLRTLDVESRYIVSVSSEPALNKYLTNLSRTIANSSCNNSIPPSMDNDMFLLKGIRSLRISESIISDSHLHDFPEDFKKYQLQRFELTYCPNITSLGVARFLAQCWSLKSVWVDKLATYSGGQDMSASLLEARAINWECTQIEYLDVFGAAGSQELFENIVLKMVASLDKLEFFGMSTEHVLWLTKLKPVTYTKLPRPSKDSEHGTRTNGRTATNTRAGTPRYNELTDLGEPTPPGLFGAVKTLSLEGSGRSSSHHYGQARVLLLEQMRYLYDAFPALRKIVYSSNTFPCIEQARDWLLQTPRQIGIDFRPKNEASKDVWDV